MELMLTTSESTTPKITFLQVAKEALMYLKNPTYLEENSTMSLVQKVRYCARIFLLQLLILPFLGPLIFVGLKMTQAEHIDLNHKDWAIFSYIVVLGPILEELIFRGLLRFNRSAIAFWMALILGTLGWYLSPSSTSKVASIFIAFFSIFLFYVITQSIENPLRTFWEKHFMVVFHFVAIAFALIHLGNFTNISNYFWALPLVSIQLSLGYFIGFLRMKFGFWYGVGLHIVWNSFFTFFTLIENL